VSRQACDLEAPGRQDKAWLGTFHTPSRRRRNTSAKSLLAVGKIYTSPRWAQRWCAGRDPTASAQLASTSCRPHRAERSTSWQSYYQSNERCIFQVTAPEAVRRLVSTFIDQHCSLLRQFIQTRTTWYGSCCTCLDVLAIEK
jgi:hypothetical protein